MARIFRRIISDQVKISEPGKKHLARWIARKGPTGAICAMFAGGKAYNGQPSIRIAKGGDGRIPEIREF